MIDETTYLRRELIKARGLLASASGILSAGETIAPGFAALPTYANLQKEIAAFQAKTRLSPPWDILDAA